MSTQVTFGGYFDDGGVYSVPPNLLASPPPFGENKDRVGAYVANGSVLEVNSGGSISARDNAIGDTVGIFADTQAIVTSDTNTLIRSNEIAIGDAIGVVVKSDAAVTVAGNIQVTEDGNGSTFGLIAEGASKVSLTGSISLSEEGNGDAVPFHLLGSAQLFSTAAISVFEDGNAARVGALVEDTAAVHLAGGSIIIRSDGLSQGTRIGLLELADVARVLISGGQYAVYEDDLPVTPYFTVNGESQLRVAGKSFDRPFGGVLETSGMITGTLTDGRSIAFEFTKGAGAGIILVPEPTSLLLALIAVSMAHVRFTVGRKLAW